MALLAKNENIVRFLLSEQANPSNQLQYSYQYLRDNSTLTIFTRLLRHAKVFHFKMEFMNNRLRKKFWEDKAAPYFLNNEVRNRILFDNTN